MTFAVEFAHAARQDLIDILDFIAMDNPRRGALFVDEFQSHIQQQLAAFPNSGRQIGQHRFLVFRGYVAVYTVDERHRRVIVILVAEGHREWRSAFE